MTSISKIEVVPAEEGKASVVVTRGGAKTLASRLVWANIWYEVTPLPDGDFRVSVKAEHGARLLGAAK